MTRHATNRSRVFIRLAGVAFLATVGVQAAGQRDARAHDPHHPFGIELLRSCADRLNGDGLPVDAEIGLDPAGTTVKYTTMPAFPADESNPCWSFAWLKVLTITGRLTTLATFGGPNIGSAEATPAAQAATCSHSALTYGVYQKMFGHWSFVGGGVLYGKYVNGICQHDDPSFIPSVGTRLNQFVNDAQAEVRIGVQSWSHDDPAIGHHENRCDDNESCFWPTQVLNVFEGFGAASQ